MSACICAAWSVTDAMVTRRQRGSEGGSSTHVLTLWQCMHVRRTHVLNYVPQNRSRDIFTQAHLMLNTSNVAVDCTRSEASRQAMQVIVDIDLMHRWKVCPPQMRCCREHPFNAKRAESGTASLMCWRWWLCKDRKAEAIPGVGVWCVALCAPNG